MILEWIWGVLFLATFLVFSWCSVPGIWSLFSSPVGMSVILASSSSVSSSLVGKPVTVLQHSVAVRVVSVTRPVVSVPPLASGFQFGWFLVLEQFRNISCISGLVFGFGFGLASFINVADTTTWVFSVDPKLASASLAVMARSEMGVTANLAWCA